MAKWGKRLFGLLAAGSAVAGLVYYFKKRDSYNEDDFSDAFEDEDFDLDSDLKPVTDREYVPLTPSAKKTEENTTEKSSEEEKKEPSDNSEE